MQFTRSIVLPTCALVLAIGCGGDDGSGGTEGEDSSSDDGATMTDVTMTGATMTDATLTMTAEDTTDSSGTAETTEGSGTETSGSGPDTGTETGDTGTGTGTETGAGECDANGMNACNDLPGCIFLGGECLPVDRVECGAAMDEETCALLPDCLWDARAEECGPA